MRTELPEGVKDDPFLPSPLLFCHLQHSMALPTVSRLLEWLLQSEPSTRAEIVRVAGAPPEDVAAAIIGLQGNKMLVRSRLPVAATRWKRGYGKPRPSLLNQPLSGFRSRTRVHASTGEVLSWIDDTVIDAARAWAPRAPRWNSGPSDAQLAQAGIDGENFLASRLFRRPVDREAALFWREVETSSPALWWIGPQSSPYRCATSTESCAAPAGVQPGSCAEGAGDESIPQQKARRAGETRVRGGLASR